LGITEKTAWFLLHCLRKADLEEIDIPKMNDKDLSGTFRRPFEVEKEKDKQIWN